MIAFAAAWLGFGGIAEPFAEIGRITFTIFLILGVLSLFGSETKKGSLG